jgi:hypothetical protein
MKLIRHLASCAALAGIVLSSASTVGAAQAPRPPTPTPNAKADYQLGGSYAPVQGVSVVVRDWFTAKPLTTSGAYSICYVNAFQTQPNDASSARPDLTSAWPKSVVLTQFEDPNWPGEYLINLRTAAHRMTAFNHVKQMINTCAAKGFNAIEFDNLDSWTRLNGLPFGKTQTVAYAKLLADYAHTKRLAVGQKNTVDLGRRNSLVTIGFDFAIAEECGAFDECSGYTAVFANRVIVIEYTDEGFAKACQTVGASVSVIRRDVDLTTPGNNEYVYASC